MSNVVSFPTNAQQPPSPAVRKGGDLAPLLIVGLVATAAILYMRGKAREEEEAHIRTRMLEEIERMEQELEAHRSELAMVRGRPMLRRAPWP
jgi:type VI protein secretion system component VasF